jgi:DNA-binding NtrC family response regulator
MVVIVDDDEGFRHGLAEHLRDDGHPVVEYGSPGELPALETLSRASLLITDYQMPGEDGLRLAQRFHQAHPQVPVIIVTAHWAQHLDAAAQALEYLNLCRKPLEYFGLHELIHKLTDSAKG